MSQNVAMQPAISVTAVDKRVTPSMSASQSEAMQPFVNTGALSVTPPGA